MQSEIRKNSAISENESPIHMQITPRRNDQESAVPVGRRLGFSERAEIPYGD